MDGLHVFLVVAIEALYVVPCEDVILMTYLCCTDVGTYRMEYVIVIGEFRCTIICY